MQNDDGGWPVSGRAAGRPRRTARSRPRTALIVAKAAGYAVPDGRDRLEASARLADIEQFFPPELDQQARWTLRAYALHVRALQGGADPAAAQALYDEAGDELPARRPRVVVAGDRRRRRPSAAIERRLRQPSPSTPPAR